MTRFLKIIFLLILIIVIAYLAGRLYDQITDGFSLDRITYAKPFREEWNADVGFIQNTGAFNQPYHYLGKGHQTFVFESLDGKYVIKFLKCHLVEIKPWLNWLPSVKALNLYKEKRVAAKEKRLVSIFNAWMIANELLKEETGIFGIHINNSNQFSNPLIVQNKSGWEYEINLNRTAFILQKKVDMLVPVFENYAALHQEDLSNQILKNLIQLYERLCSLGISDDDPQIMRNTGISHNQPILIDVGRLKLNPDVKDRELCMLEINKKMSLFLPWLHQKYPAQADYVEKMLSIRKELE